MAPQTTPNCHLESTYHTHRPSFDSPRSDCWNSGGTGSMGGDGTSQARTVQSQQAGFGLLALPAAAVKSQPATVPITWDLRMSIYE